MYSILIYHLDIISVLIFNLTIRRIFISFNWIQHDTCKISNPTKAIILKVFFVRLDSDNMGLHILYWKHTQQEISYSIHIDLIFSLKKIVFVTIICSFLKKKCFCRMIKHLYVICMPIFSKKHLENKSHMILYKP